MTYQKKARSEHTKKLLELATNESKTVYVATVFWGTIMQVYKDEETGKRILRESGLEIVPITEGELPPNTRFYRINDSYGKLVGKLEPRQILE